MKSHSFLITTFIAVLAASSFAQRLDPSQLSLRVGDGLGRAPIAADTAITPAAVRALEKDAFQLINTERSLAGLPTLRWSDKVAEVARLHSNNMADRNFFSHRGLDGLMVDDRAARLDLRSWAAIGENIAFMKGYEHPVAVAVENWLRSTSHRNNMMDARWTETAVGVAVTSDGKYYFTQVFIR